jgi:hypothetical protein
MWLGPVSRNLPKPVRLHLPAEPSVPRPQYIAKHAVAESDSTIEREPADSLSPKEVFHA